MLKAFEFTSANKVMEACGSRMRFARARYIQVVQGISELYHLNGQERGAEFWVAQAPSRTGFGHPPKRTLPGNECDDEGLITSTRGACAPRQRVLTRGSFLYE